MKRIGFDHAAGVLVVMGGEVYPPCALTAELDAAGMIHIVSVSGRVEVYEHWTQIAPLDAADDFQFADEGAALAYLRGEFCQAGLRGAEIFAGDTEPDPAFGLTGDLFINATTGDLFKKGD